MQPSSPSKSGAGTGAGVPRTKSRKRIHRGDVSSSAASSSDEADTQTTPKRKVVHPDQPTSAKKGASAAKAKKMTLQERLQAAAAIKEGGVKAKVKKSKSNGESLASSASVPDTTTLTSSSSMGTPSAPMSRSEIVIPSTMPVQRTLPISSASASTAADKVVVCVRIKPTTNPFTATAYDITPTSLSLSDEHPKVKQRGGKSGREDGYTYTFDKLLQHPSTTPELYSEKVAPLVEKAMNGFNSTIFAYGQTGSGKSFTMTGIAEELGIIPCAVDGVFDAITADTDRAFLLRVSYIEIYNETLRDLLNFKKSPLKDDEKPSIHTAKGKVYVDPLVEEIVSTPQGVMDLLERGNVGRRIGATDWNERSSRSHCVFTIVIESRPRDGDGDEDIRLSRLNLIDLAGSEKAVSDSERRGEGKHINQSLLALREVVHKLTDQGKVTHIPYRNSKLTHLLENALGGDSNICVICTMSGEEEHCAETLETLKFAGRCSQVKTNAQKNVLPSSERALIRAKDQEIEELRMKLQGFSGQPPQRAEPDIGQISDLAESVAVMEARKAKLTTLLAKLNGEILTSELPRSSSGLPLSPPKPKRRRISDFSALVAAPGRIGLGVGMPGKVNDRRAISGMTRVLESAEDMPGILGTLSSVDSFGSKNFDHERALAALRRTLADREQELKSANRELSEALSKASLLGDRETRIASLESDLRAALESHASLRGSLEQAENTFRDQTAQLEGTRSELVATIEDKASKIDELETKVLDLRKSRDELVIEDQQRLDEVQAKLDSMLVQNTDDRTKLDAVIEQLAESRKKANDAEWYRAEEVERHQAELARIKAQQGNASQSAEAAQAALQEYEAKTATQVKDLLAAQATREAQVASLLSEKESIERQRDEARSDLDRFQKEALANETKVLAELRDEIGKLRKVRDEDKEAWKGERTKLESEVVEVRKQVAEKDVQLVAAKTAQEEVVRLQQQLEEGGVRELKLKEQMSGALNTLGEAAKANSSLEKRLQDEVTARQTLETNAEATTRQLAHADEVAKQLEVEVAARRKAEDQVAQFGQDAEERDAAEKEARVVMEQEVAARKNLEKRMGTLATELESAKKSLEVERHAKQAAEVRIKDLSAQLESATASSGDQQSLLTAEVQNRQIVEARITDLLRELEEAKTLAANKDAMLVTALNAQQGSAKQIDEYTRRLEVSAEIEKRLGEETAAHKSTEKRAEDLSRQLEDIVATSGNEAKRLAEEIKTRQALEAQVSDLRRQLEEARSAIVDLEKRLAEADTLRQQAESRSSKLAGELDAARQALSDIENRLKTELIARQEMDKRLTDLSRQAQDSTKLQEQLDRQLAAVQEAEARLADLQRSAARSEELLASQISARKEAEKKLADISKELVDKHESAQAVLEEEIASLRQALNDSQTEVNGARSSAELEKSKAATISADLMEAKTELLRLQKEREKEPAPIRISKSRQSVRLSDNDREEIARLERVVEVQEGIINEQRERIERWAKEMEKQREIVRLLTNDPSAFTTVPSSPSTSMARGHGHAKSHSIAISGPNALSGRGFPSTFTARNLALPSAAAAPSPLPMHPSQFDNTSIRKGRRVTIEHDMDRLSETSKVNKARAAFESPEKATVTSPAQMLQTPPRPLRTAQAASSVPRQRRP